MFSCKRHGMTQVELIVIIVIIGALGVILVARGSRKSDQAETIRSGDRLDSEWQKIHDSDMGVVLYSNERAVLVGVAIRPPSIPLSQVGHKKFGEYGEVTRDFDRSSGVLLYRRCGAQDFRSCDGVAIIPLR